MSSALQVDKGVTAFPLLLSIDQEGIGGVVGKSPTVAVRKGSTTGSYYDFSDNTFKTVGWALKDAPLTDVGDGHYQRLLDISNLPVDIFDVLIAEFSVDDGGDVIGDDADLLVIVEAGVDLKLIRQSITNRMETLPGLPGRLTLYDDDGVSIVAQWDLVDSIDGAIVSAVGVPAKRSAKL